jgi:TetR/AcrR family transcriptional repressor of nem operon
MSDIANAIMDAAEKRIRKAGFNGFSFREIAADVGIKSSSVHYHFPTKEKLAAAVIRRYTGDVSDHMDERFQTEPDLVKLWTTAFRTTIHSADKMCPCSVLGATAYDLPEEVAVAVKGFFNMCRDKMVAQGMTTETADFLLATSIGAQVVSIAMHDAGVFDHAIAELMRARGLVASQTVAAA